MLSSEVEIIVSILVTFRTLYESRHTLITIIFDYNSPLKLKILIMKKKIRKEYTFKSRNIIHTILII